MEEEVSGILYDSCYGIYCAGNTDAAADVVKTYPEYVGRALGATEERDRLARELARARRRFARTAWIAAIAVAATVLMLLSAILP